MKIQVLVIAAALASGATAFAATANDPGKLRLTPVADTTTTTTTTKKTRTHHRKVTKKHHAATQRSSSMGASSTPNTDVDDKGRQARMDDALSTYRQKQ